MNEEDSALRRAPDAGPVEGPRDYPFPKGKEGLLPWSWPLERLEQTRSYWLATVRPNGHPHVAPLWGVWVDNALYFEGSPQTRWARNLAKNPAATIHLSRGEEVVIVEGIGDWLRVRPDLARRIVEAWLEKYGRLEPDPATRGIYRLRPQSARAWSTEYLGDGTRWRFDPP